MLSKAQKRDLQLNFRFFFSIDLCVLKPHLVDAWFCKPLEFISFNSPIRYSLPQSPSPSFSLNLHLANICLRQHLSSPRSFSHHPCSCTILGGPRQEQIGTTMEGWTCEQSVFSRSIESEWRRWWTVRLVGRLLEDLLMVGWSFNLIRGGDVVVCWLRWRICRRWWLW